MKSKFNIGARGSMASIGPSIQGSFLGGSFLTFTKSSGEATFFFVMLD